MTTTANNNRSTFVYACFRAMEALQRIKNEDDEVHDGCGEDAVVGELYGVLEDAIDYFDAKYLDGGTTWHAGVYDYDVWDIDSESAKLMYELLVMRAIRDAMGYNSNFLIGTVADVVDGYAASNNWRPGKGGVEE